MRTILSFCAAVAVWPATVLAIALINKAFLGNTGAVNVAAGAVASVLARSLYRDLARP